MKPKTQQDRIFVKKGWGHESIICNSEKYCGKVLFFEQGKRLSWHYHLVKDEHFWLADGLIVLKYSWEDDLEKAEQVMLEPGMSFHVPTGLRHQMIAVEESRLIEFSTEHKDEDSIRIVRGD